MKYLMIAVLGLTLLSGCERYQTVSATEYRTIVQDRLTGKFYYIYAGGHEWHPLEDPK